MDKGLIISNTPDSLMSGSLNHYITDKKIIDNISNWSIKQLQDNVGTVNSEFDIVIFIYELTNDFLKTLNKLSTHITIPIIFLVDHNPGISEIRDALKKYKVAIISYQTQIEAMPKAIEDLKEKGFYLCNTIKDSIITHFVGSGSSISNYNTLTPTETEILNYSKSGFNINETAYRMGLSKNTIAAYRSKILAKMNCRSMTELISKAI